MNKRIRNEMMPINIDKIVDIYNFNGPEEDVSPNLCQWEEDNGSFRGIGKTTKELPPGLYNIMITNQGLLFCKKSISTNDLIKFKDSSVDLIMGEIDKFWSSKAEYNRFDVQYKRGILMHGPPGSGKSSIIKLLIRDVIRRGGIAVELLDSRSFEHGMEVLRKIHKNKPVVCIMEDMEVIMRNEGSNVLNMLDGATTFMDNIVFVATSNYPEQLEQRIKDRPSRFDRVIEVGFPSAVMRRTYLQHLFGNAKVNKTVIKQWVKDTDGLTFPHLQELFLSVHLYKIEYASALERIKSMSKSITSDSHRKKIEFVEEQNFDIYDDDDDEY